MALAFSIAQGPVPGPAQHTVENGALGLKNRLGIVTLIAVPLMEDGQLGAAGVRAQKHVESESSIASENVTIPHQNMAGGTAMDQMLDHDRAMLKLVQ